MVYFLIALLGSMLVYKGLSHIVSSSAEELDVIGKCSPTFKRCIGSDRKPDDS